MRKSKNVNSEVSGEPIGAYFRLLFRWPVWYLHTGILYVWFGKEDNPETAAVEAVVTEELIKVIGTPEKMTVYEVPFLNIAREWIFGNWIWKKDRKVKIFLRTARLQTV